MDLAQGINYIKSMGLDRFSFDSDTSEHVNTFIDGNGDFILEYKLTKGTENGCGQRRISVNDIETELLIRKLLLIKNK